MTYKRLKYIRGVVPGVFFFMTTILSAQESWITTISDNSNYQPMDDEVVLRTRDVALGSFAFEETITVDLFDTLRVTAQRLFVDQHKEGSRVWVGRIANQAYGYMLISVKEDAFWCKIELDDGSVFTIGRPSPSAEYLLKQVVVDHYFEDGCANIKPTIEASENEQQQRDVTNICEESSSCTPALVKCLVVYNASARTDLGGTDAQAIAAIAAAVSEMNLICTNSNVDHSFNLAHAQFVTYSVAGGSTDLSRLRNPTDGYVDTVHFLRDKYYADLVSMVLGSGSCGYGNLNTDPTQFYATNGFSTVTDFCLTLNKSWPTKQGTTCP